MTTGRINQVTIPQGTSPQKNPSASASSHGTLPFSTDNVHWQSARPFGPVRPAYNHSIFATSLHYSTLVSFGHTSGTTKSTECPEHTSGKNAASSESHCLSILGQGPSRTTSIRPLVASRPLFSTMRSFHAL